MSRALLFQPCVSQAAALGLIWFYSLCKPNPFGQKSLAAEGGVGGGESDWEHCGGYGGCLGVMTVIKMMEVILDSRPLTPCPHLSVQMKRIWYKL